MDRNSLDWNTFLQIEMRVGTIVQAAIFPKAKRPAYRLTIDFGPLGILKSSAQITCNYGTEELVGRQVIAVVNFPPKQIADFMSECLVLGAYSTDGSIILLTPDMNAPNGAIVG